MEALGICIDGNEVKFALLRKEKESIEVVNMEKVIVQKTSGDKQLATEVEESYEDVFGMSEPEKDEGTEEILVQADSNLMFNTISKYIDNNPKIGVNILQSDVLFTNVTTPADIKKGKVKKLIKEELLKLSKDIDDESYGFLPKKENEYVAFYHNKNLGLLDEVSQVKKDLKSDLKISLVDINEVSLINLFTSMVDETEGFSIFIYVGNEFSRIMFFDGKKLVSFSQIINEGYRSETLPTALYGKIVFEHDTVGFDEINSIFITGDGDLSKYETFFKAKFPESKITKLPLKQNFIVPEGTEMPSLDGFALPISIAWKILEGKEKNFIDTNFLPDSIRKQQKAFAFTWHSLILVALILLSIGYFFYGSKKSDEKITKVQNEIGQLDIKINGITPIITALDSISNEIRNINSRIVLVDSLRPKKMLYSELMEYFSRNVRDINSLWLTDLTASYNNFTISGNSLFRTRIHRLASIFESANINNVNSKIMRNKTIYDFNITGRIPQKK